MQDELALVKEELRPLRQQLREAAAKQERNDRLLDALEHERELQRNRCFWKRSMPSSSRHKLQVSSLFSQPV